MKRKQFIALITLAKREVMRFFRIWTQTLLPAPISIALYFLIFGSLMGKRIGLIEGYPYITYIAPGLIMMAVINSAFGNVVASVFSNKFLRNIEEMLVSSMNSHMILLGFLLGGLGRGCLVGLIVTLVASCFTHLPLYHVGIVMLVVLGSALLFSLIGFINAIFAKKFDDINTVPTFVLTPLTYLGGVFYSTQMLPPFWQKMSYFNPLLYIINAFRYGMLGTADVQVATSLSFIVFFNITFYFIAWFLLHKGIGIKG